MFELSMFSNTLLLTCFDHRLKMHLDAPMASKECQGKTRLSRWPNDDMPFQCWHGVSLLLNQHESIWTNMNQYELVNDWHWNIEHQPVEYPVDNTFRLRISHGERKAKIGFRMNPQEIAAAKRVHESPRLNQAAQMAIQYTDTHIHTHEYIYNYIYTHIYIYIYIYISVCVCVYLTLRKWGSWFQLPSKSGIRACSVAQHWTDPG